MTWIKETEYTVVFCVDKNARCAADATVLSRASLRWEALHGYARMLLEDEYDRATLVAPLEQFIEHIGTFSRFT